MLEKTLMNLLEEAKEIREQTAENETSNYYDDVFFKLSNFISKKLNSLLFQKRNVKIIVNHFDEILPYIAASNINILLLNFYLFVERPNFKEKFIKGLKKYPYADGVEKLFYNIWVCLSDEPSKFDNFMDSDVLKTIATMGLSKMFYIDILNKLNEDNQKIFLEILVENKCDIPYLAIEYKGNNKQMIYDNLALFIENAQNLYNLMNFVKNNYVALSQVKDYIDNNEDRAINSIFCEINYLVNIKEPTLKEIIRLMILDVMKNENVKFSDITYDGGVFSCILLIGDKVIKLGNRITKSFPNNPYIVAPLLRKEFEINNEKCFIEVTERVDTNPKASKEELYQLFKNLRDLGLIWTDIKEANVGRLKRKNLIHWQENLDPTEEVLGLGTKRGKNILDKGDLVVLDADFIYDENDSNIIYANDKHLYDEFEQRYQREKRGLKEQAESPNIAMTIETNAYDYDMSEQRKVHR